MADYQVTCIRRDGRDLDRRIDRIGGFGWSLTIDDAIQTILNGEHRFWTSVNNQSVWIVVRKRQTNGRLYLATENDGYPPNNLLSLPECP